MANNIADAKNTKKILPIILCSILVLLLIFGAVVGTIALISELSAVVSYNGIRIKKGVASYLLSTYKASYTGDKSDTDALEAAAETYVRRIAVAAYLFDRNTSLSDEDREWIDTNVREVLDYRAENSVDKFNESSENMGFDYDDFVEATELLYKAANAMAVIYGVNGSKLAYAENVSQLSEYFESYSYVKILFIRTETRFAIDAQGNRIPGGDGNDETVSLSAEERAERAAHIAQITERAENANNKVGIELTEESFDSYYEIYNDDPDNAENGYYFREGTVFTEEYRKEYPNLVDAVLRTESGKFAKSVDGETVCFIYKTEPRELAFASSDMAHFFSDFYAGAAVYLFRESVNSLAADVRVKDGYRDISISSLSKNSIYRTPLGIGLNLG